MRAAAYIRVSSKSQTLDMQRDAIERAAKSRRDTITEGTATSRAHERTYPLALGPGAPPPGGAGGPRPRPYHLDRLAAAASGTCST
jgi:hypothetical protein